MKQDVSGAKHFHEALAAAQKDLRQQMEESFHIADEIDDALDAKDYIKKHSLTPHPEGGWYRQVYGNDENGEKQISTIYYMLCDEDFSAFHRLHNMVEIWYYHAGEPLDIYVISTNGELTVHHLSANDEMQVVIEPEQWFAAELPGKKGFSLVGCAVAPAFTFGNFELAKKETLLHDFPQHKVLIDRMCR